MGAFRVEEAEDAIAGTPEVGSATRATPCDVDIVFFGLLHVDISFQALMLAKDQGRAILPHDECRVFDAYAVDDVFDGSLIHVVVAGL